MLISIMIMISCVSGPADPGEHLRPRACDRSQSHVLLHAHTKLSILQQVGASCRERPGCSISQQLTLVPAGNSTSAVCRKAPLQKVQQHDQAHHLRAPQGPGNHQVTSAQIRTMPKATTPHPHEFYQSALGRCSFPVLSSARVHASPVRMRPGMLVVAPRAAQRACLAGMQRTHAVVTWGVVEAGGGHWVGCRHDKDAYDEQHPEHGDGPNNIGEDAQIEWTLGMLPCIQTLITSAFSGLHTAVSKPSCGSYRVQMSGE